MIEKNKYLALFPIIFFLATLLAVIFVSVKPIIRIHYESINVNLLLSSFILEAMTIYLFGNWWHGYVYEYENFLIDGSYNFEERGDFTGFIDPKFPLSFSIILLIGLCLILLGSLIWLYVRFIKKNSFYKRYSLSSFFILVSYFIGSILGIVGFFGLFVFKEQFHTEVIPDFFSRFFTYRNPNGLETTFCRFTFGIILSIIIFSLINFSSYVLFINFLHQSRITPKDSPGAINQESISERYAKHTFFFSYKELANFWRSFGLGLVILGFLFSLLFSSISILNLDFTSGVNRSNLLSLLSYLILAVFVLLFSILSFVLFIKSKKIKEQSSNPLKQGVISSIIGCSLGFVLVIFGFVSLFVWDSFSFLLSGTILLSYSSILLVLFLGMKKDLKINDSGSRFIGIPKLVISSIVPILLIGLVCILFVIISNSSNTFVFDSLIITLLIIAFVLFVHSIFNLIHVTFCWKKINCEIKLLENQRDQETPDIALQNASILQNSEDVSINNSVDSQLHPSISASNPDLENFNSLIERTNKIIVESSAINHTDTSTTGSIIKEELEIQLQREPSSSDISYNPRTDKVISYSSNLSLKNVKKYSVFLFTVLPIFLSFVFFLVLLIFWNSDFFFRLVENSSPMDIYEAYIGFYLFSCLAFFSIFIATISIFFIKDYSVAKYNLIFSISNTFFLLCFYIPFAIMLAEPYIEGPVFKYWLYFSPLILSHLFISFTRFLRKKSIK